MRHEPRRYSPLQKESELRDKIVELSKGVASIKEHFDEVKAKKEEKTCKKWEKEQLKEKARRREEEGELQRAAETARHEAKKKKKEEKAKQDALLRDEMKKYVTVTLHALVMMSEIKDDWLHQWKMSSLPTLTGGVKDAKGKKKVEFISEDEAESDYNTEESETSVAHELSEKTQRLCLSEKRKREDGLKTDDSPPIEQPAKRTPRRPGLKLGVSNTRVTRSKMKEKVIRTLNPTRNRTLVKTSLSKAGKSNTKKSPQATN
ncbi:hypothetical protein CBR_g40446 [Chara braunii]|uniref:Uncharacterized protein n=1 Tax=Chara braunii TaxID=69332 RepID=A0A388LTR1_CHABU|nr:hypothetical protein CBR_g40446 [Chara braunii]|eukprot:GBG85718.1 hypothetical protein CBR_g40446 [Chara braunii]